MVFAYRPAGMRRPGSVEAEPPVAGCFGRTRLEPARPARLISLRDRVISPAFSATGSPTHAVNPAESADRFAVAALVVQHGQHRVRPHAAGGGPRAVPSGSGSERRFRVKSGHVHFAPPVRS